MPWSDIVNIPNNPQNGTIGLTIKRNDAGDYMLGGGEYPNYATIKAADWNAMNSAAPTGSWNVLGKQTQDFDWRPWDIFDTGSPMNYWSPNGGAPVFQDPTTERNFGGLNDDYLSQNNLSWKTPADAQSMQSIGKPGWWDHVFPNRNWATVSPDERNNQWLKDVNDTMTKVSAYNADKIGVMGDQSFLGQLKQFVTDPAFLMSAAPIIGGLAFPSMFGGAAGAGGGWTSGYDLAGGGAFGGVGGTGAASSGLSMADAITHVPVDSATGAFPNLSTVDYGLSSGATGQGLQFSGSGAPGLTATSSTGGALSGGLAGGTAGATTALGGLTSTPTLLERALGSLGLPGGAGTGTGAVSGLDAVKSLATAAKNAGTINASNPVVQQIANATGIPAGALSTALTAGVGALTGGAGGGGGALAGAAGGGGTGNQVLDALLPWLSAGGSVADFFSRPDTTAFANKLMENSSSMLGREYSPFSAGAFYGDPQWQRYIDALTGPAIRKIRENTDMQRIREGADAAMRGQDSMTLLNQSGSPALSRSDALRREFDKNENEAISDAIAKATSGAFDAARDEYRYGQNYPVVTQQVGANTLRAAMPFGRSSYSNLLGDIAGAFGGGASPAGGSGTSGGGTSLWDLIFGGTGAGLPSGATTGTSSSTQPDWTFGYDLDGGGALSTTAPIDWTDYEYVDEP